MHKIAIVVLNWNGLDDTLGCLDSLLAQDYKNYSIVVIDNGSVDNSAATLEKYVAAHQDKVTLVCNPVNLGFAGGVNTGIKWAIKTGYDAVALFNNDATADTSWLTNLEAAFDDETVGISTGLLLHEDGKTIDSTGDWFSTWGLAFPRGRGQLAKSAAKSGLVFGATGGATLYRTSVFNDVGLFDEAFFAYYEDADISFRAQLAGWKVHYSADAIAYHKQGATSNKIPGFTVYQTFKNLPLLFVKNVPRGLLFSVGVRFKFAYVLMYLNTFTHGTGWPATKGVFKSFSLGPSAINHRRRIQRSKRVSTAYIKSILWDDLPPDQTGIRKVRKLFTGK